MTDKDRDLIAYARTEWFGHATADLADAFETHLDAEEVGEERLAYLVWTLEEERGTDFDREAGAALRQVLLERDEANKRVIEYMNAINIHVARESQLEARVKELEGGQSFPIQDGENVSLWDAAEAYAHYTKHYGFAQDLRRLAARGGFGKEEYLSFRKGGDGRHKP